MALTIFKVEWFKKLSEDANTYESTGIVLDQVKQVKVNLAIGSREDTVVLTVSNSNQLFDDLSLDDKIEVSVSINSGGAYTKLFSGIISDKSLSIVTQPNMYTVTCANLFEKFFKVLTPMAGDNEVHTADYYIRKAIGFVNDANKGGLQIGGVNVNPSITTEWVAAGNDVLTTNIHYTSPLKEAHRIITELSSKEFNKEDNYFTSINSNNDFIWTKLDLTTQTGVITEGTDFVSMNPKFGLKDVITQLIVICGPNPDNTGNILVNVYDTAAGAKYGVIAKSYNPFESGTITEEMVLADRVKHDPDGTGALVPASYPFITAWSREDNGLTETTTSVADYRTKFIAEARRRGRKRGEEKLLNLINPKWSHMLTLANPSTSYSLGGRYDIKSPQTAWVSSDQASDVFTREFILTGITHQFDKRGWVTNLKFQEIDLEQNIF